jgi:cytoskeletal protein CcmA (bactofilin family)
MNTNDNLMNETSNWLPDEPERNLDALRINYAGKGELSVSGNLEIDGKFSGKLKVSGNLTVGKDALIIGELAANDLILFGRIQGSAKVVNKVTFHTASVFSGSIAAKEAEILPGSSIRGDRFIGRESDGIPVEEPIKVLYARENPVSAMNSVNSSIFRI